MMEKDDIGAETSKSEYKAINSDSRRPIFMYLSSELTKIMKKNRKIAPGGGDMLLILPTKCSA